MDGDFDGSLGRAMSLSNAQNAGDKANKRIDALERKVFQLDEALKRSMEQQTDTIRMVRELTGIITRMTGR